MMKPVEPLPPSPPSSTVEKTLRALKKMQGRLEALERAAREPIALVGMACRFPGGAHSPDALWQLLIEGRDAIREISGDRWPSEAAAPDPPERATRWAGLLENIDGFDAEFFGIAPREAASMDPQQRLLLEVAWEALEHAGLPPSRLQGSRSGVFIGISTTDFQQVLLAADPEELDAYAATGTANCFAAGRLSYVLGLQGPSMAVDTACASSLVALHLACQSLRAGESDLALAGGVSLIISPAVMRLYAKLKALSPDGRCKTFDADANGFVRGEGCGVVVLKRLSDAIRDRDRIWALLRGSAVNQDGRSAGLTAPNVLAQQALLRQALESARASHTQIGYVEAHGTGTSLGDPIELAALRAVLGEPRSEGSTCAIGSIKTNLGHLEAAAGIAGLMKVVLSFQHRTIPPHLHFETLNPRVDLDGTPFVIPTSALPWSAGDHPRLAGVSSFSLSGTNAHVIVEEPPPPVELDLLRDERPALLPLSARSPEALSALARSYQELFAREPELSLERLKDIACSASLRRDHHEHRLAVTGSTAAELLEGLEAFVHDRPHPRLAAGEPAEARPRVVFVFAGQGSQWNAMGRALLVRERVFREAIEECDAAMRELGVTTLFDELTGVRELARHDVIQRGVFAMQVALARLLRSLGVEPDAVVGHSMGEVAAAHVAGALSLRDAVKVICVRSEMMLREAGTGSLMVVELPASEARQAAAPYDDLVVAAVNSPSSTVLAGSTSSLEALGDALERRGVLCRRVKVDVPSHSPRMDSLLEPLRHALRDIRPGPAGIPICSTLEGEMVAGTALDADYWARNLRAPVLFAPAVARLAESGHHLFVEVSPHPVLHSAIEQTLQSAGGGRCLPVMRRNDDAMPFFSSLGALFCSGYPVPFEKLYPGPRLPVVLPSYPWQRRRFPIALPRAGARSSGQPAPRAERSLKDSLYEIDWEVKPRGRPSDASSAPGTWLLLADRSGVAEALARGIEARGGRAVLVFAGRGHEQIGPSTWTLDPADGDSLSRILASLGGAPARVVHLFNLDIPAPEGLSERSLLDAQTLGPVSALNVLQGLLRAGARSRLFFVTRGALPVGGVVPSPAQALVWGLGKTLAVEHPGLWGGMVDLAPNSAEQDAARQLLEEISEPDGEDHLALRGERRHVARLVPVSRLEPRRLQVDAQGSYLITGGLGHLGLQVAEWLVARGARNLVLLGRRGLTDASRDAVGKLEQAGARVLVCEADLAERADLARALEAARALPKLRGVVHAAGIGREQPFADMKREDLLAMLRPKVLGTWLLHELTLPLELDFFICCSSISAAWGAAGVGHYAAANHFLDVFAHLRVALGQRASTINWGPLGGGGMLTDELRIKLERLGMRELDPASACSALDQLAGRTQTIVIDVDAPRLKAAYDAVTPLPLFSRLEAPARGAGPSAVVDIAAIRLRSALPEERRALLTAEITARAAAVLGIDARSLGLDQPLSRLGLDSLMAVELRNAIQRLGITLPLRDLLRHATVASLVALSLEQIGASAAGGAGRVESRQASRDEGRWVVISRPDPRARMRLFCFPHAGGGPAVFRGWAEALPPDIELCAIQAPGRGDRLAEAPLVRMDALVGELAPALRPYLDRPFAFFGICLGAVEMFEVAARLRAEGGPLPAHLFVSAARAPRFYTPEQLEDDILQFSPSPPTPAHELPDAQFLEVLRDLNFASSSVLFDDAEMRRLMLPTVRADFELSNTYTNTPGDPLDIPITAVGGRVDPYVTGTHIAGWRRHTSSSFKSLMRPGDHYFTERERPFWFRLITEALQ